MKSAFLVQLIFSFQVTAVEKEQTVCGSWEETGVALSVVKAMMGELGSDTNK